MKRIITIIVMIVLMAIFATGCQRGTYPDETTPEVTISDTTGPDPIVNPSTGPNMQQPDVTIPAVTGTLPSDSFETGDGTGTTAPDVTEPEVTTPAATTPVVTTPAATTPAPTTPKATTPTTTPKATEPVTTTPKPTEPTPTTPKATEPTPTTAKPTEPKETKPEETEPETTTTSCRQEGRNHWFLSGSNKCANCGMTKEAVSEERRALLNGVTPDNISVENTAGWTTDTWNMFKQEYASSMTNEQKRAYLIAYYDGYDCGVAGHNCKNANDHKSFTRPCPHCGLTLGCVGRIRTDELGFTYCSDKYCYSYDIKTDPSYYCQTCGKPRSNVESDPTKRCSSHLGSGTCGICGVEFSAGCHTCKQSDIDNYKKN